jgi:hypothetical protein
MSLQKARQPSSAMPHVLTAMETSKELGLFALHRLTVVMLADVSIDMAESLYAQELINEVYGKVSFPPLLPDSGLGERARLTAFGSACDDPCSDPCQCRRRA